jgi:hypothetical protein
LSAVELVFLQMIHNKKSKKGLGLFSMGYHHAQIEPVD